MLTTLITPTSGSAEVAGYDVVTERRDVRRSIGYVGQGNGRVTSSAAGTSLSARPAPTA